MKSFVESLWRSSEFGQSVVHHEYIAPHAAQLDDPEGGLADPLRTMLARMGIQRLYTHQARAVELVRNGRNVMVATPTASGKTLIYTLPVLEKVLDDPSSKVLYLFPLKALERDQWRAFNEMCSFLEPRIPISSAIYDGDTAPQVRKKIKSDPPNVLITNPEMLHLGMLAFHQGWESFFSRLRFVIIDEVHTYRGIFGSHMAQLVRRLNRICEFYGSSPVYLLSSATVSNPLEFCERLTGQRTEVINENGAPSAGRHVLFLNPDSSPGITSARLFIRCLRKGYRTIAFTQSRKVTELIHMWVSHMAPELKNRVSSYRAGFLPEERRTIENDMSSGRLLGVISTSALEMGIDIGGLDVCILVGYPGTMITTWQRGGRVGRSDRESLMVLVAQPDALDQYFMRHPERFFDREFEAAVLDPNNRDILKEHIPCAAAEEPISDDDRFFSPAIQPLPFEELEREGKLLRAADRAVWYPARQRPHRDVNLRSVGETFAILDSKTKRTIGSIDGLRAFKECHPGAIYLHKATQFVVDGLDIEKRNAFATAVEAAYYTRVQTEKETAILEIQRSRPEGNFLVKQGRLRVTEMVTGFEKRRIKGQELLGKHPLDLPEQIFETVGIWIEIEDFIKQTVEQRKLHFMGGIHAMEHALIAMFPLFALCDRNDVGGISYPFHPDIGKSAVFIYDGYPGGVGLAEKGFDLIGELLEQSLELIVSCDCEEGCPSCIHSPKCGSGNKPLDKAAAQLTLEMLLGRQSPDMEEESLYLEEKEDESHAIVEVVPSQPNIAVLDLETQRSAAEVGGWNNAHLMRVSVAVVHESLGDEFHIYYEKDVAALLVRLKTYDLVVGFNIKRFDYKVLQAYSKPGELDAVPTFDILEYVHKKLGFRLSLDKLATATLKTAKTGHGLEALKWFKEGEMEKLTDYCKSDVAITRDLFLFGLNENHLLFENKDGQLLRLPTAWDIEKLKEGKWD